MNVLKYRNAVLHKCVVMINGLKGLCHIIQLTKTLLFIVVFDHIAILWQMHVLYRVLLLINKVLSAIKMMIMMMNKMMRMFDDE